MARYQSMDNNASRQGMQTINHAYKRKPQNGKRKKQKPKSDYPQRSRQFCNHATERLERAESLVMAKDVIMAKAEEKKTKLGVAT